MGGHARDQYQTTGESAGSVPDSNHGNHAHASSDAIEVITYVMPVRLRIEELCIR